MKHNPYAVMAVVFGIFTLVMVSRHKIARWYRKVRRRRGGVYAYRCRKPRGRRRHWAYVGESVNFYFRDRDHRGTGNYGGKAQPWSDLDPVQYRIVKLPWWLCWKWVLRPLETLIILALWPVYNDKKNRWNPRRIPRQGAQRMRIQRDAKKQIGMWVA